MKVLYIDACVREESRTRRLAKTLLQKLGGDVESVSLYEQNLPFTDKELLAKREQDCRCRNFQDAYYDYAKQFAEADVIVVAAPYWDLSFPAILKQYIELIMISGITFHYTEEGIPVGMCKAKKLYYVTTAGGKIYNPEYSFGYLKSLATGMLGVVECQMISAENLDIIGNDVEAMLQEAESRLGMDMPEDQCTYSCR